MGIERDARTSIIRPLTPHSKITFSQAFKEKCVSEVVRIGSMVIFYLGKLWKAKFFMLCNVIFLVRLRGKFEIDHPWASEKVPPLCVFMSRDPNSLDHFIEPFHSVIFHQLFHFTSHISSTLSFYSFIFHQLFHFIQSYFICVSNECVMDEIEHYNFSGLILRPVYTCDIWCDF